VNPFIELMQAAALIMLLFAAVLIMVVLRNADNRVLKVRLGPAVIGAALLLFAIPIYASVLGSLTFERFSSIARSAAAILLPLGLYLMSSWGKEAPEENTRDVVDD
jgi:hypothetical protein